MDKLEKRLYHFVPYQLIGIQKGIQGEHSALDFVAKYGKHNPNHLIWDYIENWKTVIYLNGGSTNTRLDEDGNPIGTLNVILRDLVNLKVEHMDFYEPDLQDALTGVVFIVDERVFEYDKYPDIAQFMKGIDKIKWLELFKNGPYLLEDIKKELPVLYKDWEDMIGGPTNVALRYLLKGKKLA